MGQWSSGCQEQHSASTINYPKNVSHTVRFSCFTYSLHEELHNLKVIQRACPHIPFSLDFNEFVLTDGMRVVANVFGNTFSQYRSSYSCLIWK